MDKSEGDLSQQQAELIELSTLWDRVCKLSVNKQERLDQAHKLVGTMVQYLSIQFMMLMTSHFALFVLEVIYIIF